MNRDDDDYEYNSGFGSSRYDEPSGGARGQKSNFHSTHGTMKHTDFNTGSMVDEEGRVAGFIKVSNGTANLINTGGQLLIPTIRRFLQKEGEPLAQNFAKNYLGHNAAQAAHFGTLAGDAIGYATIFYKQIADVASGLYDYGRTLNDLRKAVTPVVQGEKHPRLEAVFGSGGIEMFDHARAKAAGILAQRMITTGAGTIRAIPQLMIWNAEEKTNRKDRKRQGVISQFQEGKASIDDMVKMMEEELGGVGKISAANMEEVREKLITKLAKVQKEKYAAAFEEFKRKEGSAIKKELEKEIGGAASSEKEHVEAKERYGIPHGFTKAGGYYDNNNPRAGYYTGDGKDRKISNDFSKRYKDAVTKAVERKTRSEFMKQQGAPLDHSWTDDWYFGKTRDRYNQPPQVKTRRAELEERVSKDFDALLGKGEEAKKLAGEEKKILGDQSIREFLYTLAGSLAGDLGESLLGGNLDKFKTPLALDYVINLNNALVAAGDAVPEMVPSFKCGNENIPEMSYTRAVHTIFQKHQEDGKMFNKNAAKWGLIANREFEHLEKHKWDDEEVQRLDRKDLTPYEFAVVDIARRLKQGTLAIESLEMLVSCKNVKIVHDSGRSFGPKDIKNDSEEVKDAISRTIDEQAARFTPRVTMNEADAAQADAELPFSDEDVKFMLSAKGLQGDERAFFFGLQEMLVPDPKRLCTKTGMNQKECAALHKEFEGRLYALLSSGVEELVADIEADPKKAAEKLKISDEQVAMLVALHEKAEAQGKDIVEVADKKELRVAEMAVASALITQAREGVPEGEKGEEKQGFWQKLVARSKAPKEKKVVDEEALASKEKFSEKFGGDGASLEDDMPFSRKLNRRDAEDVREGPPAFDRFARDDAEEEMPRRHSRKHGRQESYAHAHKARDSFDGFDSPGVF